MTLTQRRILYSIFFLIFFITAPIVIFWAEGYRYNFKKHRVEKTGVLFLESKPSRAQIYLNGKPKKDKTTARLKNLLPDDYQVEIKKEGFQTWQKNLKVYGGETTFAQYVRLFRADPISENILNFPVRAGSTNQGGELVIVYKNNNQLKLAWFNLNNQKLGPELLLNSLPDQIKLTSNKNLVELQFGEKIYLAIFDKQEIIDLNLSFDKKISQIGWYNNELYAVTALAIEKLNLANFSTERLLAGRFLNFTFNSGNIIFLEQARDQVLLNQANLDGSAIKQITTLPISLGYEFQESATTYLSLLDNINEILFLINPGVKGDDELIKIFPETKQIKWFKDENLLLYNDFEIMSYNLEEKKNNLILRLSTPITTALWYPVPTHVIYAAGEEIKAAELVAEQRVFNVLAKQAAIQDVLVNDGGDKIYLLSETGIWQVEIQ